MQTPLNVPTRTAEANALAHGPFRMPRIIVTERLVLCPLEMQHHAPLARFYADGEASRFVGGPSDEAQSLMALAFFAGQWQLFGFGHYAICDKAGTFVGAAGIYMPIHWPEPEIGYFIVPSAQRQGYGAEAVRAIRDEAARRGATTLVSYIGPKNAPSVALAESVGATLEGPIILRGEDAIVYRHEMPIGLDAPGEDIPYLEAQAMPSRITTQRLTLTAWRADHFEPFAKLFDDAPIARYIASDVDRRTAWRAMVAGAGAWQLRGYGTYAIEHEGQFSGFCGLYYPLGWPQIELAYTLAPHARGKGFASEAVRAVRSVATAQGLGALESYIDPDNAASIKVAEGVGATLAGETELNGVRVLIYRHPLEQIIAREPVPA
ncbi:MAG: GNAT family N-acetyltransferase [Pseudomonadota bacterium]